MNLSVYFLICILVRCAFIYMSYLSLSYGNLNLFFSGLSLVIGISFFFQYIIKYRKKGAFGQSIWWDAFRPLHGILFLAASYLIYNRNLYFVSVLILDTFVSIGGHIYYRYMNPIQY